MFSCISHERDDNHVKLVLTLSWHIGAFLTPAKQSSVLNKLFGFLRKKSQLVFDYHFIR